MNIEYTIVSGGKSTFEEELNRLSREGWATFSDLSTTTTDTGIVFSILLSRSINQTE